MFSVVLHMFGGSVLHLAEKWNSVPSPACSPAWASIELFSKTQYLQTLSQEDSQELLQLATRQNAASGEPETIHDVD